MPTLLLSLPWYLPFPALCPCECYSRSVLHGHITAITRAGALSLAIAKWGIGFTWSSPPPLYHQFAMHKIGPICWRQFYCQEKPLAEHTALAETLRQPYGCLCPWFTVARDLSLQGSWGFSCSNRSSCCASLSIACREPSGWFSNVIKPKCFRLL